MALGAALKAAIATAAISKVAKSAKPPRLSQPSSRLSRLKNVINENKGPVAAGALGSAGIGLASSIPILVSAGKGEYDVPPPVKSSTDDTAQVDQVVEKKYHGGKVKGYFKGGKIDGVAVKGKTRGRVL